MRKPQAEIVSEMNQGLRAMSDFLARVDVDAITPQQAARIVRFFDAAQSVASAGIRLVEPVVDRAAGRR
jgi:hypothetical protein